MQKNTSSVFKRVGVIIMSQLLTKLNFVSLFNKQHFSTRFFVNWKISFFYSWYWQIQAIYPKLKRYFFANFLTSWFMLWFTNQMREIYYWFSYFVLHINIFKTDFNHNLRYKKLTIWMYGIYQFIKNWRGIFCKLFNLLIHASIDTPSERNLWLIKLFCFAYN